MPTARRYKLWPRVILVSSLCAASGATAQNCGPFTDVLAADPYCPSILQLHYLGMTAGTSPSTFGPALPVTRQVLALILARATDSSGAARGSRRAALGQFWTTQGSHYATHGRVVVGATPISVRSDGEDLWVATSADRVDRVHARDGTFLGSWTGLSTAVSVQVAMGRVYAASGQDPAHLFEINPSLPPGAATDVATLGGSAARSLAFDGAKIWTSNFGSDNLSIATPGTIPWSVTTVGGFNDPTGLVWDGANMWVADSGSGNLYRLNAAGGIVQTVFVGDSPQFPVYDGTNIWVPRDSDNTVTVVRAATGAIVANLTGNGQSGPYSAAYDGERVLVTNSTGNTVSLWRAVDLTTIGSFPIGGNNPQHPCSDGIDFWVPLLFDNAIVRF